METRHQKGKVRNREGKMYCRQSLSIDTLSKCLLTCANGMYQLCDYAACDALKQTTSADTRVAHRLNKSATQDA